MNGSESHQLDHIEGRLTSIEVKLDKKQDKLPTALIVTIAFALLVEAGTFLWYGGQIVGKINEISADRYHGSDAIRDFALVNQRVDQLIIRVDRLENGGGSE